MNDPTSVYLLYGFVDDLLYVGITRSKDRRFRGHADDKDWWEEVHHAEFEHYPSREQALKREAELIVARHPKYNRTAHDGMSDDDSRRCGSWNRNGEPCRKPAEPSGLCRYHIEFGAWRPAMCAECDGEEAGPDGLCSSCLAYQFNDGAVA